MISLVTQPAAMSLSRNPIIYTVRCVDASGNPYGPVSHQARINTSSYFSLQVGDTIVLSWTEEDGSESEVTFTAVATPDSITEIPSISTPGYVTYSAYWTDVAEIINAHYMVRPHFQVSYENIPGVGIRIVATAVGTATATFENSDISSSYKTYTTIAAGPTNLPDGHQVLVDVFVERIDFGYVKVGSLSEKAGPEGYASFDIQDFLESELNLVDWNEMVPEFNSTELYLADTIRNYYIRFREDYENMPSIVWQYADPKQAMRGGISETMPEGFDFFSELNSTNSLISQMPDTCHIERSQPVYIAWYNYDTTAKVAELELTKIFEDGTTEVSTAYPLNGLMVEPGRTVVIPVGYTQLGIDDDTVVGYTVQVLNVGLNQYLSQVKTYWLNRTKRYSLRYLIYLNGFGVPETIACIGAFSTELQVERFVSNNVYSSPTGLLAKNTQYYQSYQNIFTYRTGYITRKESIAIQVMLIYNRLWDTSDEENVPLILLDDKFKVWDTIDFLSTFRLNVSRAIGSKSFDSGWLTATGNFWATPEDEIWQNP